MAGVVPTSVLRGRPKQPISDRDRFSVGRMCDRVVRQTGHLGPVTRQAKVGVCSRVSVQNLACRPRASTIGGSVQREVSAGFWV